MSLLTKSFQSLIKANRLSIGGSTTTGWYNIAGGSQRAPSQSQQLQAMGNSGWLFSVVDRIATSFAAVSWQLYRRRLGGEVEEILDLNHPFLKLWNQPNPFWTGYEFRELAAQHLELTGEIWWLILTNGSQPTEYWPLRPDRMTIVPNRDKYISGYIYTIGTERIPLTLEQVVFVRRPNPWDLYRGISVIESIMTDLEADRESARYNSMFFRNGATPGGVIEMEESLSDAEFDKFVERWQMAHQGVNNAYRVAVLERAKWHDTKVTQRDMQFEQLRKLSRDIILGAFGMPASVVGITETVNRANAEAGDVTFARWILLPRLRRLREVINSKLLPRFGNDLYCDFIDPSPDNRELDLAEATQGYRASLLTRNEARQRLDEDAVEEGGDEFAAPQATPSFPGFSQEGSLPTSKALAYSLKKDFVTKASAQDRQEAHLQSQWRKWLKNELADFLHYMEDFKAAKPQTKFEISDIFGYAWDWWTKYGSELFIDLSKAYLIAILSEYPTMPREEAQRYAANYARQRGAELLQVPGDLNIAEHTRTRVREVVAEAIENGDSYEQLAQRLRDDLAFSSGRAATIARTEMAFAEGQGGKQAANLQGLTEKRWITVGDERVESLCIMNEAIGWISTSDLFPSGHDTIPVHPNDRCIIEYRDGISAESQEELISPSQTVIAGSSAGIKPFRCAECNKLLSKTPSPGALYWCPRCKAERSMDVEKSHMKRTIKRVERDAHERIVSVTEETIDD